MTGMSPSATGVSARLDATCLSIVDGFRRNDVEREKSCEEADDPETRDGVGIVVGGRNGVLAREAEEWF